MSEEFVCYIFAGGRRMQTCVMHCSRRSCTGAAFLLLPLLLLLQLQQLSAFSVVSPPAKTAAGLETRSYELHHPASTQSHSCLCRCSLLLLLLFCCCAAAAVCCCEKQFELRNKLLIQLGNPC